MLYVVNWYRWHRCLHDEIDAVVYVMSLSGYNQGLYEDHSTNCLEESLELFQRTASLPKLAETNFVVFLNKNGL